jgi:hypothetical protein
VLHPDTSCGFLDLIMKKMSQGNRERMEGMNNRWIEDFEQSRRNTDDSRFLDDAWLAREESTDKKGLNAIAPPLSLLSGNEVQGWFAKYPALYAIPALAIGTLAFLLIAGLLTS